MSPGHSRPVRKSVRLPDGPSRRHRDQEEGCDPLFIAAERYCILKKLHELSEKSDIMVSFVGSMQRTSTALYTRLVNIEAKISSILTMQESISNLQQELITLKQKLPLSFTAESASYDALLGRSRINIKADVTIQPDGLVVEDNERAAKAAEGTDRKENTHLNGNAHRSATVHTPSQSTFRSRFTIPRVPSTCGGTTEPASSINGCIGDTVDTIVVAPKTKLKSFQERKEPYRHEYYHDARFLQSEVSLGSSSEPVEKDDEGDHPDDNVNPLLNDIKEKSSMYVRLPQKPQCNDLPPSLHEPLVDQHTNPLPNHSPGKDKKLYNNNKEPEADVESTCFVDCLYYTQQCCDCSIM